jgi:hypothetical protein
VPTDKPEDDPRPKPLTRDELIEACRAGDIEPATDDEMDI